MISKRLILTYLLSSAVLLFAPYVLLIYGDVNICCLHEIFQSKTYSYALVAAFSVTIPIFFDHIFDFVFHYLYSHKESNLITFCVTFAPNVVRVILLGIDLPADSELCTLLLLFVQVAYSFGAIFNHSSFYCKNTEVQSSSKFTLLSISIVLILNSFSHVTSSLSTAILLSFSIFLSSVAIVFISITFHRVSTVKNSVGIINFYSFLICLISILAFLVGCILLRLISLYAVEGMSIYINGLTILSSLCTLPVFMLDGRIARYDAIKNEVC